MSPSNPSASLAPPTRFTLRAAEPRDLNAIVGLIGELAAFESLTHQLQVTPEKLAPHLFGPKPVAEALVVDVADSADAADAGSDASGDSGASSTTVAAFALFFTNFSTFLAQPGLYLEDLYVQPVQRGRGIGKALLTRLAQTALERGCGRFEWSVLDWNEPAIRFYRGMGATVMPDWRICRVTGEALARFGAPPV